MLDGLKLAIHLDELGGQFGRVVYEIGLFLILDDQTAVQVLQLINYQSIKSVLLGQ